MTALRKSASTRMALTLGLLLTVLLSAGYAWLSVRDNKLIAHEELGRAQLTARTMVASLKSIMLAGRGNIAHDWLKRVMRLQHIESAKIYRINGTEAFVDLTTIHSVNAWNSEAHFHRQPGIGKPSRIPPRFADPFKQVVQRKKEQFSIKEDGSLTLLYPIRVENACLRCHGYTNNPLRGVLALKVSTIAASTMLKTDLNRTAMLFAAIAGLLILGTWVSVRRQMIAPLSTLVHIAERIHSGDLSQRINLERNDEFGEVALAFDELVVHLKEDLAREQQHVQRQKTMTEAVIGLSKQSATDGILRHVGQLAMDMTGARYAMLGHKDTHGKMHFIPLGLTPDEERKIAHPPIGDGLLGLLFEQHQTVRIDNISKHPASVGFPDGHPPMTAFLGTPIVFENEMMGAIYLTREEEQPFNEEDEMALRILASACAVALSNARNMKSELAQINQRLRNREIELELTNEELGRAGEAKDQFLANTSHELRTPLNAIIGFSELLGNPKIGALTEKQARYVEHVHGSGKRLLGIINDLLDISKIEAGMMDIEETQCVPIEIARQAISGLKPLSEASHLSLGFEEGIGADTCVITDSGKLHQMLVNLLGNAIKFTAEGGAVSLSMRVDANTDAESRLIAEVKDTGIGIAEEDQERIFEPFIQAKGGLDRRYNGTGLGLALTRKQVNILGGDLSLQSKIGEGSCFTISLPVKHVMDMRRGQQEQEDTASAVVTVVQEVVPEHGPQPRILILDENKQRGEAVAIMMRDEAYDPLCADIADVKKNVLSFCPFLIMLGLQQQSEETYKYMKMLRSDAATRDIPLVFIGGAADTPEFSLGTVDFIPKGIDQQGILDSIARYKRHTPSKPRIPTVLVVDDDALVREFLQETMVNEGYRTLLAVNGEEGICVAIEREPDLIILDLTMPNLTGFDVIHRLRMHPSTADTPIIIYTAKDLSRDEALRLNRDAERILIKGADGRSEILRQLQRLELAYPVQAHLMDTSLHCFNHRYLLRRLEQETANAKRYGQQFSLIGWQMDSYDAYIGEHGNRWGVAALKEMIETVMDVTRDGDICTRTDTSRFVLLLPNIPPTASLHVAEKLRIRINHQRFPLPDSKTGAFTLSIGIVHFGTDGEDSGSLLKVLAGRIEEAISYGGNQSVAGEI